MSSSEKSKKIDWPQPVRRYVQRAFQPENNIPGIGREEMESKLKETITRANEQDSLSLIDWDVLPLPQAIIQKERKRSNEAPAQVPWRDRTLNNPRIGDSKGQKMAENDLQSKKRKSTDLFNSNMDGTAQHVPWRKTNKGNTFEDRITHRQIPMEEPSEKRPQNDPDAIYGKNTSKLSNGHLEKRQKRFDDGRFGTHSPKKNWASRDESPASDIPTGPVVGRCQDLEKRYFRLTSAPNPDTVRPLPVLELTLDLLKKKWRKDNNYSYICDQFKSLRQDLTVQHIKNEFTVSTYEIHARIALEKGDLGEYNQCQTQLRVLYSQNLGGHPMEFKAYRILYFIHTCNRTDMNDVLADLTPIEKKDPAVKHALDVRSTLALGNYHRFFRLYLETPNMGAYLMDMFVVRERLTALANICRAYRPDVKIRFVTEELGFETDGESVQFLVDHNGQSLLEEREEGIRLLTTKAGQLFDLAKDAAFRRVDIKGQI
ncbi:MAG: Leukocyte receptor cluster (LRC) member 8 [Sclerophora amabilis]|nr:MAG: Leukocyte receptor cluster (LRC) member 8 [Sclerophora amabilis]